MIPKAVGLLFRQLPQKQDDSQGARSETGKHEAQEPISSKKATARPGRLWRALAVHVLGHLVVATVTELRFWRID